jgi:hypothetical protein
MMRVVEMFRCVFILGRVAAPDVSAGQAQPQVHPLIAHLQAFQAPIAAGLDVANFFYVFAD